MKYIELIKTPPGKLSDQDYRDIIALHQSEFDISEDFIKSALQSKNIVHLYRDKHSHKLLGTVAFQWYAVDQHIIMYIGSVVIDPLHQKSGFFTHSLISAIVYTYFHFPFKNKMAVAFSTTPQAYRFFSILNEYWPRPDQATPPANIQLLKKFMEISQNSHYEIKNGGIIINNETLHKISERNPDITSGKNDSIKEYFYRINPQATEGAQLVCQVPFSMNNFLHVFWKMIFKSKFRNIWQTYLKYKNYVLYGSSAILLFITLELFIEIDDIYPLLVN